MDEIPSQEELDQVMALNDLVGVETFVSHGELVVDKLIKDALVRKDFDEVTRNLDEFCVKWRNHFIETMKPKCLSEYWDPKRSLERRDR